MVLHKIKNLFSRIISKQPEEFEEDSAIKFKMVLYKEGKNSKLFDESVVKLIDTFLEYEIFEEEVGEALKVDREKFITVGDCYTVFSIPMGSIYGDSSLSSRYDSAKKTFQLVLARDKKYRGFQMLNAFVYDLPEEFKQVPINFTDALIDLYGELRGVIVEVKKPDLFKRKHLAEFFEGCLGVDIYVNMSITLKFIELGDSFYNKISEICKYLIKKKLVVRSFPKNDMKIRYANALKEFKEEVGEEKKPEYLFFMEFEGILLEHFIKMEKELFEELNKLGFEIDYNIELTSFEVPSSTYGCFVRS